VGPEDGGLVVVVHHCDGIGIGVCCHTTSGEAFGEVARGYGEFDTHAGCFDFCLAQAEGDLLLALIFQASGLLMRNTMAALMLRNLNSGRCVPSQTAFPIYNPQFISVCVVI
jgi:hypothetical protein